MDRICTAVQEVVDRENPRIEQHLRRLARKQGLRLRKSRYGRYFVTTEGESWRSRELLSPEHGMRLDEAVRFLQESGAA